MGKTKRKESTAPGPRATGSHSFARHVVAPLRGAEDTIDETAAGGQDLFLRRHQALRKKYQALLRRMEAEQSEHLSTLTLSKWLVRTTSSALAMVRRDTFVIANTRWRDLDSETRGGTWSALPESDPRTGTRYASLNEMAVAEAKRVLGKGPGRVLEERFHSTCGRSIEVFLEVLGKPGKSRAVVLMIHDVTDRARAERELARARQTLFQQEQMRVIGELASGLAHDLNNTFNAVSLRLAILEADPTCSRAQGGNLEILSRITKDAADRIGQLQDFARTRHDRPLSAVDLRRAVKDAMELALPEVEEKASLFGTPIELDAAVGQLPFVIGDAAELSHVFVNLILNARDAMPRGGRVRIRAHKEAQRIIVTVEDQGIGIPPDKLGQIFDPFYTTKGRRGTGLGLAIASSVMSRLGGAILAQNLPGGGAAFVLTFPIATKPASRTHHATSVVSPRGRHVLVIDDDQDNLDATRAVLTMEGQEVDVADGGATALTYLREGRRYDLILCDVGMPEMNGWQVAQAIKDIASGTVIYLLTGWAQEIPEHDPRRKLVRGVLRKPISLDEIKHVLAVETEL